MKNILRLTNLTFLIMLVAAIVVGCVRKDDFYKENTDETSRKEVVQISGADDAILFARDANPPLDTFVLIDVRRYPNKETGLNQPLTVKLVLKPSLITDYNTANGTSLIPVPFAAYTLSDDITTVTFQPGEAIKGIKIRLNKGQLDLSKQYALGFSLTDAGTGIINTALQDALYIFIIKNAWEADYTTSGFFFHPSAPRALDDAKHIYTVSGTRSEAGLGDLYGAGYYFAFDVSGSNTLTSWDAVPVVPPSSGFYTADNPGGIAYPGPELPGTAPFLQSTYNNTYNPATKTFYMHYGYGVGSTSQNGWTRNVYEKWVRQ